ncbi:MAG: nickel pincer cofactor biosynthesis protein LarC [Nitrosopumilaceae archaeon]
MVVVIDPQIAGISGDMLLSSLVNIGADKSKIIEGAYLSEEFLQGSKIKKIGFEMTDKHGTEATELVLDIKEDYHERKGIEIQQCIMQTADKIGLSERAKLFSNESIKTLMRVESKIHGQPIESVHFHEAASIDTVIDMVGVAIALEDLKYFDDEIITSPVAVGGGKVTFSHGTSSNPASAILGIFQNSNIIITGGQVKEELTTPTGASLLVNLASNCSEFYPTMKVKSVGYGAGKKNFEAFANVLKIVQGEKLINFDRDSVQILETNIDDVPGEVLGHLIEKIMENDAKDVTISHGITKKGRPTNLVSIICDSTSMNKILDTLISETGTLGVRIRTSERIVVPRVTVTVPIAIQEKNFTVRCKMAKSQGIVKNFKIEADDIKSVADSLSLSFKQADELIRSQIRRKLDLK